MTLVNTIFTHINRKIALVNMQFMLVIYKCKVVNIQFTLVNMELDSATRSPPLWTAGKIGAGVKFMGY